jgi:hypothetical protein
MRRPLALAAAVLALAAGCSSGKPAPRYSVRIETVTQTATTTPPPYVPPPATSVAPLPPGAAPPVDEQEGDCPYIASTPEQDPTTNVADIVGSHVYRTTRLTVRDPVGCRFYFYAPPYGAVADIEPLSFGTPVAAHNAMVRTGEQGTQVIGQPDLAPGVQGVSYRTAFYGPDDGRDWACAFAAGDVLVVVHTQRTDTAVVDVSLARAIVAKF